MTAFGRLEAAEEVTTNDLVQTGLDVLDPLNAETLGLAFATQIDLEAFA